MAVADADTWSRSLRRDAFALRGELEPGKQAKGILEATDESRALHIDSIPKLSSLVAAKQHIHADDATASATAMVIASAEGTPA